MPTRILTALAWTARIAGCLVVAAFLYGSDQCPTDSCDSDFGGADQPCGATRPFCENPADDNSDCVACRNSSDCSFGSLCGTSNVCSAPEATCFEDSECGGSIPICTVDFPQARARLALDPFADLIANRGPSADLYEDSGEMISTLSFSFGSANDAVLRDLDLDGDPDVLVTSAGSYGLLLNQGDGSFVELADFGLNIIFPKAALFNELPLILLTEDSAQLNASSQSPDLIHEGEIMPREDWSGNDDAADAHASAGAVGDLNGDDREDMVIGHSAQEVGTGTAEARIWFRDAETLTFTQGPDLSLAGSFSTHAITLEDVDSDGDLDIITSHQAVPAAPRGTTTGKNVVWLNQGGTQGGTEGAFTESTSDLGTTYATAIAFADLDGDDDLDAILANGAPGLDVCSGAASPMTPNTVWINQGGTQAGTEGEFIDSMVALGSSASTDVLVTSAVGRIGVWFTNLLGPDDFYLNDGGTLTINQHVPRDPAAPPVPGERLHTTAVKAADFDGDGDEDILFVLDRFQCDVPRARGTMNTPEGSPIYTNTGSFLGECVQCTQNSHCGMDEMCINDECIAAGSRSAQPMSFNGPSGPFGNGQAPMLSLDSGDAGVATRHTFTFGTAIDDLETYAFVVHYPYDFGWNGFSSLGPVGTEVGRVIIDEVGSEVLNAPLVTYNSGLSFVDHDDDGEPASEILLGYQSSSSHRLTATFPWGDFDPSTLTNSASRTITLVLNAGLMSNPAVSGDYDLQIRMISIDPDNGNYDDGAGTPPVSLTFQVTASIAAIGELFVNGFESGDTTGWSSTTGQAPPGIPGDTCTTAINYSGGTLMGSLLNNTASGTTDSCGTGNTIDEWVSYTATCNGTVTVSTCHAGTDLDTILSVRPQAGCEMLASEIACNDDAAGAPVECDLEGLNRKSTATFAATAGVDYVFRVSAFNDSSGTYEIDATCTP